jgi:pimeloyl-ACP methyl ester carboxylesterase
MLEKLPSARKVTIEDAAHLPNMDQPQEFQRIVKDFLDGLPVNPLRGIGVNLEEN